MIIKHWQFVLLLVISGLTILFVPIPSILRESAQCKPCAPGLLPSQCPKCPQKGDLEWRPSLAKMFWNRLFKSSQMGVRVQTVTPAGWKTYTSPLGYSFSYPASASIEEYGAVTVRIDPPDLRTVEGTCSRWISFSSVGARSVTSRTQDKYGCVYNAFVLKENVFVESRYHEEGREVIDQILSTFEFLGDGETINNNTCQYNGKTYKNGEAVPADKCNSCACLAGQIACTQRACK